jgi:hypothetical protein
VLQSRKKLSQLKSIVFGLGLIPKQGVPEIKICYNRSTKIFLGKVNTSKEVADFIRKTYSRGILQLQEEFNVLYLNRANEILGYYKHYRWLLNYKKNLRNRKNTRCKVIRSPYYN